MALKINPTFWSWRTSWSRLPLLLFISGLVLIWFGVIFTPNNDWLPFIAIAFYTPFFIQQLVQDIRWRREHRWRLIEMFVSSMLREDRLREQGLEKLADNEVGLREMIKGW